MNTDTRTTIVSVVEDAARANPFCACGSPMTAVDHDGDLWLECVEHDRRPSDRLARLLSGSWLVAHDRHLLLLKNELRAA